ncbi:hypothetical protein ACEPAI_136 [Sanghuangporus weigelae]
MNSDLASLINSNTRIKVSSTLDKSVGKKNLSDGSPETCWTSQQGLPQYIHVIFDSPVVPKTLYLTFQGGFVGQRCRIDVLPVASESTDSEKLTSKELMTVYPEDVNRSQSFDLSDAGPIEEMKLIFEESSDFFGRITVYDMRIEGQLMRDTDT